MAAEVGEVLLNVGNTFIRLFLSALQVFNVAQEAANKPAADKAQDARYNGNPNNRITHIQTSLDEVGSEVLIQCRAMQTLAALKGTRVRASLKGKLFYEDGGDQARGTYLRIIEIEAAGLWVESEVATQRMLEHSGLSISDRTPIFFVPFATIDWIAIVADLPSLSERIPL